VNKNQAVANVETLEEIKSQAVAPQNGVGPNKICADAILPKRRHCRTSVQKEHHGLCGVS
jgi:hypothetical protein